MERRLAESHVQEDRVERRVQHTVQEIVPGAGCTDLPRSRNTAKSAVASIGILEGRRRRADCIASLYARQRAADIAKLVKAMRANVVGFKQEEITQLALEAEVPAL